MDTRKITFIVETTINAESPKNHIKKIRAVRRAIKKCVNPIEGVKVVQIKHKDEI